MTAPRTSAPLDPIAAFEQRFVFRIAEYLQNDRGFDTEFSLAGLRGWMVCQRWSDPPDSPKVECLAVLSWSLIQQAEVEPEQEPSLRRELIRQLDFLNGTSGTRPASLEVVLALTTRECIYGNLRQMAGLRSATRESNGIPGTRPDRLDVKTSD